MAGKDDAEERKLDIHEHEDGSVEVSGFADTDSDVRVEGDDAANRPADDAAPGAPGVDAEDDHPDDEHEDNARDERGMSEADREAVRVRRREERKNRRESRERKERARDEELAKLRAELEETRRQTSGLDQRSVAADLARVESEIDKGQQAIEFYDGELARAITAGDGEAHRTAMKARDDIRERLSQFKSVKSHIENTARQQQERSRTPPPAPQINERVKQLATDWAARTPWYDPRMGDLDSRIAVQVDAQVAKDGFKQDSPEYWAELDTRLKKYLPHRFNGVASSNARSNGADTRRSPVAGSGQERSGTSGKRTASFVLSAERVKAIKDAGAWDDIKQRNAMIDSMRKFDAENAGRK